MRPAFLAIVALSFGPIASSQPIHDGRLFDEGRTLAERSASAPEALDKLHSYVGQWDVDITRYPTDSTTLSTVGQADVSLMNRGWSYMERLHVGDYDREGNSNDAMAFLVYNPASNRFELGESSNYSESMTLYDGAFNANQLVLTTAGRRRGSGTLTFYRLTYTFASDDVLAVLLEESVNDRQTWRPTLRKDYSRRDHSDDFMRVRDDYGTASSSQPVEARQFDFLLGEWTANHNMLLGGNWVQYPTTTTAVFALDGRAILEHSWFSLDPSHAEAATSILRLYNRAERRWESLYLNNRSNSLLHFGGNWEGDRMVLHNFNTNLRDTISRWIFQTVEADRYQWFAESSTDRGATFNETWTIDVVRK